MIQVDPIDESVEARMREYAPVACGTLEDMRGLARDVGRSLEKSGLPPNFQIRAAKIRAEIEDLEAAVSEYAVGTVDA